MNEYYVLVTLRIIASAVLKHQTT